MRHPRPNVSVNESLISVTYDWKIVFYILNDNNKGYYNKTIIDCQLNKIDKIVLFNL